MVHKEQLGSMPPRFMSSNATIHSLVFVVTTIIDAKSRQGAYQVIPEDRTMMLGLSEMFNLVFSVSCRQIRDEYNKAAQSDKFLPIKE